MPVVAMEGQAAGVRWARRGAAGLMEHLRHIYCAPAATHFMKLWLSHNDVLKSLGKNPLIVLGAPAHNYDPPDLH